MKKKRKALTPARVPCLVPWCVALCEPDYGACVVHREHGNVHPLALADGERFAFVSMIGNVARAPEQCRACGGRGECESCSGTGSHSCHHSNCSEQHECPDCDGTGECPLCERDIITPSEPYQWWKQPPSVPLLSKDWTGDEDAALRYLRAALLPSYLPPDDPQRTRIA